MIQAGGQPVSWLSYITELQRDWAREETIEAVSEIVFSRRDDYPPYSGDS